MGDVRIPWMLHSFVLAVIRPAINSLTHLISYHLMLLRVRMETEIDGSCRSGGVLTGECGRDEGRSSPMASEPQGDEPRRTREGEKDEGNDREPDEKEDSRRNMKAKRNEGETCADSHIEPQKSSWNIAAPYYSFSSSNTYGVPMSTTGSIGAPYSPQERPSLGEGGEGSFWRRHLLEGIPLDPHSATNSFTFLQFVQCLLLLGSEIAAAAHGRSEAGGSFEMSPLPPAASPTPASTAARGLEVATQIVTAVGSPSPFESDERQADFYGESALEWVSQ
eukprot:GHVU01004515.1.p1 GENE.GHVU01004515.1~~GHVU01004515.1.p1  ORF type:complete len:278 (-),score=25.12 GHVU01004515.1:624-1457(-)